MNILRNRAIRGFIALWILMIFFLLPLQTAQGQEIRRITLPTNDIIYDPFTKKIYASVPSSAGSIGNTITVIDPLTGVIENSFPIGSEPGKLAISDNGQHLYVAINGTTPGSVHRFNLASQTIDLEFSLGTTSPEGGLDPYPLYVEDMEVFPGLPESVAISRKIRLFTVNHHDVVIYDSGIIRPIAGSGNAIEFSSSGTILYGYINEVYPQAFYKMLVDGSGLSFAGTIQNTQLGLFVDIKCENGQIYSTSGHVIDLEKELVNQFPVPYVSASVKPDPTFELVYFLMETYSPSTKKIMAFHQNTYDLAWEIEIQDVSGKVGNLIRWGEGLAFRSSNEMILVRSPLIYSLFGANLNLALNSAPNFPPPETPLTLTFTVENLGPSTATGITFNQTLFADANIISTTATQGTCGIQNPILCDLGTLENGAKVTIEIVIAPAEEGAFSHMAMVSANQSDHNLNNNVVGRFAAVDYFPTLPGVFWTYKERGGLTVTTRILEKTVNVNGVETLVFQDSDGFNEYYTSDSSGIYLHRLYEPRIFIEGLGRVNLSTTFIPPMQIAAGIMEIGQSITSAGMIQTNSLPRVGVIEFPYHAEFKLEGLDNVKVEARNFDTLRLTGTFTLYDQTLSQTFYLAKDIGIVKSVMDDGVEIITQELIATNAGIHDLAITKITVPKKVTLSAQNPAKNVTIKVEIQNRGPHSEFVQDLATLNNLVKLSVESLGNCIAPTPVLRSGPPQKEFPITIKSKQKLAVYFDVTFDCANDPSASTSKDPDHYDYRFTARVDRSALDGKEDTHPEDDICPRNVPPPFVLDPNPDGKINDKGCGQKKPDGTYGGEILTDVVVK